MDGRGNQGISGTMVRDLGVDNCLDFHSNARIDLKMRESSFI